MAEAVHGDGHKCRGRGRRTTGMQGNSHEQSSESIEWIALGFHCSLRAHGCLPAAAQPPSAAPHAVHFGRHSHGLCHRAWDPSIRVETLCRLFYRRLRHQLELRVWWTGDIHAASALVALFTMLFVTVLALVRVSRNPALHSSSHARFRAWKIIR